MKFAKYLWRISPLHWPRACAAQTVGYVYLMMRGMKFDRAAIVAERACGALWNGLPS